MVRTAIYGSVMLWVGIFCLASSRRQVRALEADPPRLLVLRNGSILQGEITRRGSFYHVVMPRGEFQVPVGQVDSCCRSPAEAYKKRAARTGPTADSHRQLAAWCLRHDMLDDAAVEVRAVRAIDPDYPGLEVIENQIAQASQRAHGPRGHPRPTSVPATNKLAAPAQHRDLPQAARRQFVRQIEPILLYNCATSGCHTSASARPLRLDRLAIVGAGHPGLARQNLASVLKQIDSVGPQSDTLLTHATTEHGSADRRSKPLNTRQAQLLRSWIRSIPPASQAVQGRADSNRMVASRQDPMRTRVSHPTGVETSPAPQGQPVTTHSPRVLPQSEKQSENPRQARTLQRGVRLATFKPRDPFDAEIFNRRIARVNSGAAPPGDKLVEPGRSLQQSDRRPD